MVRNYAVLCLLGILAYFAVDCDAIIGGQETELFPFRYVVSLLDMDEGHICGGAIVGEQHVLTAAHCFVNPDNSFKNITVFALMGTKDLLQMGKPAVNFKVVKVYVPKEYNATKFDTTADIAVVRLKGPIELPKHKNLIKGRLERHKREFYSGKTGLIPGWGWTWINLHHTPVTGFRTDSLLRYTRAQVLNYPECQREHPDFKIYAEHLCAKTEQHEHEIRGVCRGDDGSPLAHDGIIIGVLSKYPENCSERTESAIYTRVSHYLTFLVNSKKDFVSPNMKEHEFQS